MENSKQPQKKDKQTKQWYAMKAVYYSQTKIEEKLNEGKHKYYSPKEAIYEINSKGKKVKSYKSIGGLIFIYTTRDILYTLATSIQNLQYYPNRVKQGEGPVVVDPKQMDTFIAFMNNYGENAIFFSPDEIDINKGEKVTIVGGQFDGYQGTLLKVTGARAKRFVVSLDQFLAAAFDVECDFVQISNKTKKEN